ncbi:MAG: hypothetical protein CO189_11290 [candidate division Zixibacteria bacterium CG_4_9_14_3_um_filter_46_8]|nr:MAG: hypothetical protein CO189_11290 [candidate division Zixibacteria bacterium CG_4_9_14_3_um_filter_46_8]
MPNTFALIENLSIVINTALKVVSLGAFWLGMCIGATLPICVWFIVNKRYKKSKITLNIPFGLGNIVYDASDQDRVLAWKMYVQLKTRKAALLFDETHDIISQVYDSLHEIFPLTRDILSECCPHYLETQKSISDFVLRVLNDGIRPHLTQWHPLFRTWWERALISAENLEKAPQDLQREFPQYQDLVADLKKMNNELIKYAEDLVDIVQTKPGLVKAKIRAVQIVPEQPI